MATKNAPQDGKMIKIEVQTVVMAPEEAVARYRAIGCNPMPADRAERILSGAATALHVDWQGLEKANDYDFFREVVVVLNFFDESARLVRGEHSLKFFSRGQQGG